MKIRHNMQNNTCFNPMRNSWKFVCCHSCRDIYELLQLKVCKLNLQGERDSRTGFHGAKGDIFLKKKLRDETIIFLKSIYSVNSEFRMFKYALFVALCF